MKSISIQLLLPLLVSVLCVSCVSMTIVPLKKTVPDVSVNAMPLKNIRTVAVLPFENSEKTDMTYLPSPPWPSQTPKRRYPYKNDGEVVSDLVSAELAKSFAFSVVERKKIKDVLEEQRFQQSSLIDPSTAVELGKLVGAQAVVFGRVNICCFDKQYRYSGNGRVEQELAFVNIDFKLADVETGAVIAFVHHELSTQHLLQGPVTMNNQEIMQNPNKYTDALPAVDQVMRQLIRECVAPIVEGKKSH